MNCKELTVEKLIVKNPSGKGEIEISGHGIVFRDDRAVARLELSLDYKDGCPEVSLSDANLQERIRLVLNGRGEPTIELLNGNGESAIWLTTECETRLCLYDRRGNARLDSWVDEDGHPIIELKDEFHKTSTQLALDYRGVLLATGHDAQGNKTWEWSATEDKAHPQRQEA